MYSSFCSGCYSGFFKILPGAGLAFPLPASPAEWSPAPETPVKEITPAEMLLRTAARAAAVLGVLALLGWLGWVMLDVRNMQSGFTLPS